VNPEHRSKVLILRNPLAWLGFAVRDFPPDFSGDLFVEIKPTGTIHRIDRAPQDR
jgi:hypothetical protein